MTYYVWLIVATTTTCSKCDKKLKKKYICRNVYDIKDHIQIDICIFLGVMQHNFILNPKIYRLTGFIR